MRAEPELGQSEDPRELVRGDAEAVRATVGHLADLADGFRATAAGLRAIDTGAWTGAAADAFRARFTDAPAQWSRAAAAFLSAAGAWERFRSTLAVAQQDAGTAVARFRADAGAADMQAAERQAARRILAEARARRDAAAAEAAREIAEAAALSPDPPTGWDLRIAEAADWLGANGIELAHVAEGVGEGVESLVQFVRVVNAADPYNLNHPGRFVENASTTLSGAVDTLVHPLRLVSGFVGAGWGADPARAFGRLLPAVASGGAGSALGAEGQTARSALGAAKDAARITKAGAGRQAANSLWADPRPTAAPFAPRAEPASAPPHASGAQPSRVEADRAAAESFDRLGRDLSSRLDRLAPKDIAPADTAKGPPAAKVHPVSRARGRDGRPPEHHHDPERARQARLSRGDKDFFSPFNRHGARKSHLDERGDLVPANPHGDASMVEHVVGRRSPVKGDSPYSSFTSTGARAAVRFGGYTIEVDVVRLQADIDAGLVSGVEVLAPHRVQAAIQADADRIAGRPVDLYVRKGHAGDAARSYGLGAEATAQLRQRMIDMANAQRHHEWMIRGVVPGRYLVGPHTEGRHG